METGDGGTRHLIMTPLGVLCSVTSPHRSSPPHSLKSRHPEAAPAAGPGIRHWENGILCKELEEPAEGQQEHHHGRGSAGHGRGWTTPRPCAGGVPTTMGRNEGVLPL